MFGNYTWWAALEIQRARELEWERKMRRHYYGKLPRRIQGRLVRLVKKALRQGLSPAEIEGIVRWALGHE